MVRPHPRSYEIALGTTPGRPADRVIPLDELVVGTRDGRFYLRWTARDAEVIPCPGHMLNNMQAPDVCRFLDDLGATARHSSVRSTGAPQRGSRFCLGCR